MEIKRFTFRRTSYHMVRGDSVWNLKMYVSRFGGKKSESEIWSLKLIYAN